MGQITFPVLSQPAWVTLDTNEIESLEATGAYTTVTQTGGLMWRSPAPIELFQQAIRTGEQPVEPLQPTNALALSQSPWRQGV